MKPTAKLKKSQTAQKGHGGLVKTKLASLLRRLATRLDGADDNEIALRLATLPDRVMGVSSGPRSLPRYSSHTAMALAGTGVEVGRAFLPPLAAARQRSGLAVEVRQLEGDRLRAPQPGAVQERQRRGITGTASGVAVLGAEREQRRELAGGHLAASRKPEAVDRRQVGRAGQLLGTELPEAPRLPAGR